MATYTYEASDRQGKVSHGKFDAPNEGEVYAYLSKRGLIPVHIEKEEKGTRLGSSLSFFENIKPMDRIVLVRNLAATLRAGLNLLEAIDIMIKDASHSAMQKILNQAKFNLQRGQTLSTTFLAYPKAFPPVFIGLIKAGEASGKMEESLEDLGVHLAREYNLSKRVKSALAYPVVLLIASIGIVALLLIFVLPRLAKSFEASDVELPFITKALIAFSNIFSYSLLLDAIFLFLIVWFFAYFRKTKTGSKFFFGLAIKTPVVKDIVKKVSIVRFARTLGILINSGMSIIDSLKLSADAVGNEFYKKAIVESIEKVKNGVDLSTGLSAYPQLFPQLLLSMVGVGERTGTLSTVLKKFADFYDEEVDNDLKDLTTFLEPVLILFMGLIIGLIAVSILLPVYQLVGNFV